MDNNLPHQRFDAILSLSDSWFWETDADGNFTWFSDNVERLAGVNPTWHYGKKRIDILSKADIDLAYLEDHLRCLDQHEPFTNFVYCRTGPHGDAWLSSNGEPCFDEAGEFVGYRGTGTVVTEQHLSETHQRQLIQGLNTINQGLLLFDNEERLVFVNRQAKQFFELDEKTTVAKPGTHFIDLVQEQINRGIIKEAENCEEAWLKRRIDAFRNPNKPFFHHLANGKRLRIEHHRTDNGETIVTSQDIGELFEAEQQIKTTQNLLLTAIDEFSGGMALYDQKGYLLVANQRYTDFYPEIDRVKPGDSFEDLLRQRLAAGGIPSAIGREEQWLEDRLRLFNDPDETIMDLEYTDGKWVHVREHQTPDGTFRTLTDITRSKKLELELQSSERRFKDFAECAADVFWETDAALNYSYIGGRVEELLGLPEQALIGQPLILLHIPDDQFIQPQDVGIVEAIKERMNSFAEIKCTHILPNFAYKILSTTGKALFTKNGDFRGYRGILTDITEPYQLNLKLHHQANHDELTGLVNRRAFNAQLQCASEQSQSTGVTHTLCYLDLDQFKVVNDNAGHTAGDSLLVQIANLMNEVTCSTNILSRLGGDEFGLLLLNCSLDEGRLVAEQINQQLANYQLNWEGNVYQVGVSIGLVEINADFNNADQAMSDANLACYAAKDLGRNRVYAYRPDDEVLLKRRAEIKEVNEIHDAMKKKVGCRCIANRLFQRTLHRVRLSDSNCC